MLLRKEVVEEGATKAQMVEHPTSLGVVFSKVSGVDLEVVTLLF